jgi:PIN domain nuclease of toxin-antitoxin system
LAPRFLLDTHVLLRWITEPRKLSRAQTRILEEVARRSETVALSAITLLETAIAVSSGKLRGRKSVEQIFEELQNPIFQILPLTIEVAMEAAPLNAALRDPGDMVIVATARVHRLQLLTSDRRIIESKLARVVE